MIGLAKHDKILKGVRDFSVILDVYEAGYSPAEVKQIVLDTLRPEFAHPEYLDRYGVDLLTVEAVNMQRLRSQQWSSALYDVSMKIRRHCLASNEKSCAQVSAVWLEPIKDALALYWSAVRLEHPKAELPLADFAHETFRNIGALVEGTMQVYMKELLHLTLTLAGQATSFQEVNQLSLGAVVQQLGEKAQVKELMIVPPWNVPLNQWRNIAQHYSMRTDGQAVRCVYGARHQHAFEMTRQELLMAAHSLFLLHSALRTSHTIFFLDNSELLARHCKPMERDQSDRLFQFTIGAASQGFEVVSLDVSEQRATAELVDVSDQEDPQRAFHASQFTYQLWIATRAEKLEIQYRSKTGHRTLKSSVKASDCENVYRGDEEFGYLAQVSSFQHQEHNHKVEPTG